MKRILIPSLIFCLALIVSLSISWGVFEAMPHIEDEFANYFQAQVFASGQLWVPSPAQPGSFLVPFAVDLDGRRFSKYPPGFSAVLALGVLANAHWLVNPLVGALTLLILYAMGRDLFDAETGQLAALLGLLSPMFLGLSASLLPHALTALCLLVFTWGFFRLVRPPPHRPLPTTHYLLTTLLAGAGLGCAALTRPYTALAYALPFALLAVWSLSTRRAKSLDDPADPTPAGLPHQGHVRKLNGPAATPPPSNSPHQGGRTRPPHPCGGDRGGGKRQPGSKVCAYAHQGGGDTLPRPWRERVRRQLGQASVAPLPSGALILLGLVSAGLSGLLLLYNHALSGQYRLELYTLVWPYDRLGFGPGYGVLPGGHTPGIALLNAGVDLWDLATVLLGWPYASWLPLLLGLALPPRRRLERVLCLPFLAIVIAHSAYWVQGSGLYGPRYYYEGLPLLWLLAAHGLLKLWRILKPAGARRVMRAALAALVGLNVFVVTLPRLNLWHGLYGVTPEARRHIAQLDIHNALVFVHIRHWGDYSELAWINSLALDGDIVFALDEGAHANDAVRAAYPDRRVFYLVDGNVVELIYESEP